MSTDEGTPTAALTGPILALTGGERLLAGRYRVEQHIGRGGMAEVHVGTDTRLGRKVAIKLLKSSLANDPTFRMRFRQEAQAASRMTHPTIVRVFDAGEETVLESGGGEAQLPFIVMEFVDGKLLKDLIKDGPMTAQEAGHIVGGILTALEYSHRAGVVHRDIKPGNVMVTRSGQIKVMDFGIARAISDSSATVAQTSVILGTAQYFSPEQAKGETVDLRSDLYSTGVVLFEMLTGRAPFRGDSPIAVAYQHVSERPEVPSRLNPALTEAMDAVVLRSLEKDKARRYQSAEEFRDDVDAVLAGRTPTARLPTVEIQQELFGGADSTPESTVRRLAFDDPGPSGTTSRPPAAWIWAGVVVVAAIVLAVALWVVSIATGGFGADNRTVPNGLAGATSATAEKALTSLDLRALIHEQASSTVQKGVVIRATPGAGTVLTKGDAVTLVVSTGVPQATVPKLEGLSLDAAKQALSEAKLQLGDVTTEHSKDVQQDVVISAAQKSGATVDEGTKVDLTVSDGKVDLPDLTGQTIAAAQSTLTGLGLSADVQQAQNCGTPGDTVIYQGTPAGPVDQGSRIVLQQCSGNSVPTPDPTDTATTPPPAG
ncbi:Stk1 family PASTA domain-containing Ser/Thr kinase [Amnibacterium kyonggiense]|uniref:non-specific serine/threonine protein kinase n=1 Tax=Amnibacterium kyonggiense TaxID=595671 RepID=A0A4R7FPX5_9MICO|nr:Stk1 family PASTA domain-containing Ser/Thr kinase [Amnibacterium kyonggiense]TDS79811.1 serine/threonine-protein kinase [Amnibacterium kyonggiense]